LGGYRAASYLPNLASERRIEHEPGWRRGTESSHDSPLEGTGFELAASGRERLLVLNQEYSHRSDDLGEQSLKNIA
jgi:hypothetical protein